MPDSESADAANAAATVLTAAADKAAATMAKAATEAAAVLAVATETAAQSAQRHDSTDHDAVIRLQGAVSGLVETMAANNIASVERDTRIEKGVQNINGQVSSHELRLVPLERDRSIWNWVLRGCIVVTPIAVVVANYLTKA